MGHHGASHPFRSAAICVALKGCLVISQGILKPFRGSCRPQNLTPKWSTFEWICHFPCIQEITLRISDEKTFPMAFDFGGPLSPIQKPLNEKTRCDCPTLQGLGPWNSSKPVNRWCTISGMPKLGSTFPLGRCLGRGGLKVKRLCIGSKMHAIGASDEIKREKGAGLWGFRWNWA